MNTTFSDSFEPSGQRFIHVLNRDANGFEFWALTPDESSQIDAAQYHETLAGLKVSIVANGSVKLDYLKSLDCWEDRSIWVGGTWDKSWNNVTAETVYSKVRPGLYYDRYNHLNPINLCGLQIYVAFAEDSLDDCHIHILTQHRDYPAIINGVAYDKTFMAEPLDVQARFFPQIKVSPVVNSQGVAKVELIDSEGNPLKRNSTLHLQAVSGYVPKTRVAVVDGVGTFKTLPLGLDKGDSIDVKVGWRFFTGAARFTQEVVDGT